ncbi:MAG TPA: ChbG/HpnK family deacetylase [Vicinamibacteria bacterium]|jgi:hypothetical protein
MSSAKRLIVAAEDLGLSAGVSRGVIEAHRRGIVTSATLSVSGPAAAAVPELAQDAPGLGLGLQLAFADLDRPRPEELIAEARAQLRRFRETVGREPTHLGTHGQDHRHPGALEALLVLAWETGLPVRNVSREVHERLRREGIRTTDHVRSEFGGEAATLDALITFIGDLPFGTSELACRVSLGDAAGEAAAGRAALDALTHREARQTLQAAGVRLIHFGDL